MSGEIGRLLNEMAQASDVESRRDAATRLRDAGFARRPSLQKRGKLDDPAESELNSDELDWLHAALEDGDRSVRLNAIIIAGDLGGASSVPALERNCQEDDREIKLAAIDSLGDIGGEQGTSTLAQLAKDPAEFAEVRLAALAQLDELAAKRFTSGPDRRYDPPGADFADLEGGTSGEGAQTNARLVEILRPIESEQGADDFLRMKAADVRSYLESGAT